MTERRKLVRNAVSAAGAVLTTVSAVLFLTFFFLDLLGLHGNPYLGIFFFMILPGVFLLGLALIPIGLWIEHRRRLAGLPPSDWRWPSVDLNDDAHRRATAIVGLLTIANIAIVSLAAYRGVEYMDSTEFCGEVCHTVMEPEYVSYLDGPHSRVRCVQCHIGPGAPWFVKAKVDGLRQVWAVTVGTYATPVPSPVHSLRPARDTCEQCHWPEKFTGDLVRQYRSFGNDEANSEDVTVLRLHVGGGGEHFGGPSGIHWHTSAQNVVEYVATDEQRTVIPWVRLTDREGRVTEFFAEGVTEADLAGHERRTMDCIDCHNRPTHRFAATPDRAIDLAIATGVVPGDLPYVRREAVAVLAASHGDRATAERAIAEHLSQFYAREYAELAAANDPRIAQAIAGTQRAFTHNVFPAMQVTWGTHQNHLGHTDFPGCFRCHTDEHRAADGRTISADCSVCHSFD